MTARRLTTLTFGIATIVCVAVLAVRATIEPLPDTLHLQDLTPPKRQVLDRLGAPLSYTFTAEWNTTSYTPLHRIPTLLQRACIEAEDRRFYEHSGVDWWARAHAVWQNVRAFHVVRGASTISEQVVRMLHPRPRSLWARLIEGYEATHLEQRFTKADILEFYLNQAPFAGNRRGVAQAARYFWDRNLDTLTEREQLSLAVMLRAPGRLSLYRSPEGLQSRIAALAQRLIAVGVLTSAELERILAERTTTRAETIPVRADHFVRHLQTRSDAEQAATPIHSTLDSGIQRAAQKILEARLRDLASQHATDGAVLVVDNRSAEVLAWVNAGTLSDQPGSHIDAINTPRQPGSTLKPFLYALALERGWSAATVVSDSPLSEPVGAGLHTYHNYSRVHYGDISVREALANSLNIPAIRTIQHIGKESLLSLLRAAGFSSLTQPAEFYGEGLALGNGEVTLLELVRGYLMLATRGIYRPLALTRHDGRTEARHFTRIFNAETTSIIGDILSDAHARRLEFGSDGLLQFPIQTAVKTGTSSDYRDAWAIGFSNNFTIGVWFGNLDRTSMSSMTGARGPALVLRSLFSLLEQEREDRGLYLSPRLSRRSVCANSGELAAAHCRSVSELFVPGSEPTSVCHAHHQRGAVHHNDHNATDATPPIALPAGDPQGSHVARITMPTQGLHLALDPRIPDAKEALAFEVTATQPLKQIEWLVDGVVVHRGSGDQTRYLWALRRGRHVVRAKVRTARTSEEIELGEVGFWVR